jgi:hypothetical protein
MANHGPCERVLEQLMRAANLMEERAEWPGTKLFGSTADVHEYSVGAPVITILQTAVGGLYDWRAPFPEDLSLLRSDRSIILYSTGHEEDGGLSLHHWERDRLPKDCAGRVHDGKGVLEGPRR